MKESTDKIINIDKTNSSTNKIIKKSGGVVEDHDVGFLLYSGEVLKGAHMNIKKSGGVVEDHDAGLFNDNINVKTNKERVKRVITETKKWTFYKEELEYNSQIELLNSLVFAIEKSVGMVNDHDAGFLLDTGEQLQGARSNINHELMYGRLQLSPSQRMVYSQIKIKLRSYREQDIKKNKLDSSKFVTPVFIVNKLKESKMICFYCKESTSILYEYVREPKQWTIERLDNTYGHNCDNVVIACLSCNLRRRTSQFERYLTTKKICAGIKKLDEIADF